MEKPEIKSSPGTPGAFLRTDGEVFEPADRELADAIAALIFDWYIDAVAAQIGAGT